MLRDIIEIDEELCDGCGECVPSCAEGALAVVDGKLRVIDESKCDAAGACLGHCSKGALQVVRRNAQRFEEGPAGHSPPSSVERPGVGQCPGSRAMAWQPAARQARSNQEPASELCQWPVQLHLLSPNAPFWDGRELLVCADCVPFAMAGFHDRLLAGRAVAVACPKLDDPSGYVEKLAAILAGHNIPAMRVAILEVPCCRGLVAMAVEAAHRSQYRGEVEVLLVGRTGTVLGTEVLQTAKA